MRNAAVTQIVPAIRRQLPGAFMASAHLALSSLEARVHENV